MMTEKVQSCIKCVQAAHVARLEHLSDVVVSLESFVGTPMENDSTFKAYNGSNSLFHCCCICCHEFMFTAVSAHLSATFD